MIKKTLILLCTLFCCLKCEKMLDQNITIEAKDALVRLKPSDYPSFKHDTNFNLLKQAINNNRQYLNRLNSNQVFVYGPDTYNVQDLKRTQTALLNLIKQYQYDYKKLNRQIKKQFIIYQSVGDISNNQVLFTGYFVPVLQGRLTKNNQYRYPIYRLPRDLIKIDLALFKDHLAGNKIMARYHQGKVIPYYSHQEILEGALANRGLEIAWVDDLVNLAFMHIQGSGIVELTNGQSINVSYAGSNGHKYRSLGNLLIEEGKMTYETMSLQAIKQYLRSHPHDIKRVLSYNASYIFFTEAKHTAMGSIGVPLVERHSIATDYRIFPKGALAFIQTEKPLISSDNQIKKWQSFSRFVVNQDTGGAIRGPGRVDLFCGKGDQAELTAGHMKHSGQLYFIIKKK